MRKLILLILLLTACQASEAIAPLAPVQVTPTSQKLNSHPAPGFSKGVKPASASPIKPTFTPDSTSTQTPLPDPTRIQAPSPYQPVEYIAQSGDTLQAVAFRFDLQPNQIVSRQPLAYHGLLTPGQKLLFPKHTRETQANTIDIQSTHLFPDSQIVYSPSAAGFDVRQYLDESGGFLSTYREYLGSTAWTDASQVITRITLENSINPRLLLALMEYECGCVLGQSSGRLGDGYVLGVEDFRHRWLYRQLGWAINQLSAGYYGWRSGAWREFSLPDGRIVRPAPDSNAGSAALAYYFANLAAQKAIQTVPVGQRQRAGTIQVSDEAWMQALEPSSGFPALYQRMFGDPWALAAQVEPLLPMGLMQPEMILPFEPDLVWSFSSGPHKAWQTDGALAALDFAPSSKESGCVQSDHWVVAVADGPVVRSGDGFIIQDLDGPDARSEQALSDWREQTGWAVLYMHLATLDKVPEGTYLHAGERIGHPSCEGGPATGTHLHIARKFNGEWMAAAGPLPFVMSGWLPQAGAMPYQGSLRRGHQTVFAHTSGSRSTWISRQDTATPTPSPAP